MKHAPCALLAALLLTVPAIAQAQGDGFEPEPFPDPFVDALRPWIEDASTDGMHNSSWAESAEEELAAASAALDAARFRQAFAHYESYVTLVHTDAFLNETEGMSTSAKRAALLKITSQEANAGSASFDAFRDVLHTFDGNVTSVKAFEAAAYVASIAVDHLVTLQTSEIYQQEISRAETIDGALVHSAFSITRTPRIVLDQVGDLLDAAIAYEGVRPGILQEQVDRITHLNALNAQNVREPMAKPYAEIVMDAAANNESILVLGAYTGLLRSNFNSQLNIMYGDAQGRGVNATRDLRNNFWNALNNTDTEAAGEFGLTGAFILHAKDTGADVLAGTPRMGTLVYGWATQKAAVQITNDLSLMSPQKPEKAETEGDEDNATPLGVGVAVAGLAAAAAVAGTRRRG